MNKIAIVLEPIIVPIVNLLTDILNWINKHDRLRNIMTIVIAILASLGPTALLILSISTLISIFV